MTQQLADIVGDLLPVWAALGPFTSGEASASAMRYASLAVIGPEKTQQFGAAFKKHALSYDRDGLAWEMLRQELVSRGTSGVADQIKVANAFKAAENLLEGKLQIARHANGRYEIGVTLDQSDNETDEAMAYAFGSSLVQIDSEEARALVNFLCEVHDLKSNGEPASATALGALWFELSEKSKKKPDSEYSRRFKALTNAIQATITNESNPGFQETVIEEMESATADQLQQRINAIAGRQGAIAAERLIAMRRGDTVTDAILAAESTMLQERMTKLVAEWTDRL